MRGLADFPQHIIRGIDGIIDRALIEQSQPMHNFLGRFLDRDSADHARREPGAQLGLFDVNGEGHCRSRNAVLPLGCGFSR